MDKSDYFGLISATLAAFSVLIPFIITWIERRGRLHRSMHLIDLIKAQDELREIRETRQNNAPAVVMRKVDSLLDDIDTELTKTSGFKFSIEPFLVVISAEVFILLSAIFLRFSERIDEIMSSESWVSGVTFFEGIFQYRSTRLMLLMLCISLAVFITTRAGRAIEKKVNKALLYNVIMWFSFHVAFVALAFLGALVLYLLDESLPFF